MLAEESSDSDSDHDPEAESTKKVKIDDRAYKLLEDLGSKMTFAEQNLKRKKLTYDTFAKQETREYALVTEYMIKPIGNGIDALMKRTSILSDLLHLGHNTPEPEREELVQKPLGCTCFTK